MRPGHGVGRSRCGWHCCWNHVAFKMSDITQKKSRFIYLACFADIKFNVTGLSCTYKLAIWMNQVSILEWSDNQLPWLYKILFLKLKRLQLKSVLKLKSVLDGKIYIRLSKCPWKRDMTNLTQCILQLLDTIRHVRMLEEQKGIGSVSHYIRQLCRGKLAHNRPRALRPLPTPSLFHNPWR